MNKKEKLVNISKEIESCKNCKKGTSGKAVVGEGSLDAKIMFVGEAPGKTEAQTGRPFVGRSGKLLRKLIIEALKLKEDDVYITSPVKYLPDKGTPTKDQIHHGMVHLKKQIEVIKPKIIVLLGASAVQGVLGEKIAVLKKHGEIIEKEGLKYFLTIHPAAVIRFVKFRKIINQDFKKLGKII